MGWQSGGVGCFRGSSPSAFRLSFGNFPQKGKFKRKLWPGFIQKCPHSMATKASHPGCTPGCCFTIMPFKRNESPQGKKTFQAYQKGFLLWLGFFWLFFFNRILPKSACSSRWFWLGLSDTFPSEKYAVLEIFPPALVIFSEHAFHSCGSLQSELGQITQESPESC